MISLTNTMINQPNAVNQSLPPSISQMSQEELNAVPQYEDWVQGRTLFEAEVSDKARSMKKMLTAIGLTFSYEEQLHNASTLFKNAIHDLNQGDIYFDVGAGAANAILEYREKYPEKAKVIGLACTRLEKKDQEDTLIKNDSDDPKFSYYLGDFTQFPIGDLAKKVSVITDIQASFRYALKPSEVIKKMGELLQPGGKAFIRYGCWERILVDDLISRNIIERKNVSLDDQALNNGSQKLMQLWFQTIQGFKVLVQNPKETPNLGVVVLERNEEPVVVEKLTANSNIDFESDGIFNLDIANEHMRPRYTWETSSNSEDLIRKIETLDW